MNRDERRLTWPERMLWMVDLVVFHLWNWLFTRRLGLLAQGLPALLLAAGLAIFWTFRHGDAAPDLIARYDLAVERALARGDLVSAKVCVRKLVLLDEPGPRTRYALARLAEHEGDLPRAERLIRDLAPYPGSGHPAAHFWVAQRIVEQTPENGQLAADARGAVIHHLEQALPSLENRPQAHQWLAELLLAAGDAEQAAKHLEEAAPEQPALYLKLAEVQLQCQDDVRFQRAVKQARDYFQQQVAADPRDAAARIAWARVCILERKFEEAEQILQQGLALGDDAALQQALTKTFLAMADRLNTRDQRELGQHLVLLGKALQASPHDPAVLDRLAMFVRYSGLPADTMRTRLRELLVEGQTPATVHLLLGSMAAAAARWDEARLHLEQAYRLDSRLPALLNHLAWALTKGETPEIERALQLADHAVKLNPDEPEMRATRGRILTQLQRWQEALSDLEAALAASSEAGELHAALAQVYAALGDSELAEQHRTRAARAGVKPPAPNAETPQNNPPPVPSPDDTQQDQERHDESPNTMTEAPQSVAETPHLGSAEE